MEDGPTAAANNQHQADKKETKTSEREELFFLAQSNTVSEHHNWALIIHKAYFLFMYKCFYL